MHHETTTPERERTPLHEQDSLPDPPAEAGGEHAAETGTTVVGLTTDDAVVIAADQRASVGGGRFVTNKDTRKVERVHPSAAVALSGTVGHIQHFTRVLQSESRLYADRRGDPPSTNALVTLAGNILRSAPLRVTPLLGGVDADGPQVYTLDGGGGILADDYAAGGSGMQLAYGVLEQQYESGLGREDARAVAARAVESASERDTASGDGVTVATVTEDGTELADFDAAEEVA
jgi:proteasome beta subunit